MVGLLYDCKYIEEHFPSFVQKYINKDGEPTLSLGGVPVNVVTNTYLWGCFCQIKGPVYSLSKTQYEEYYVITGCVPQLEGKLVPTPFFKKIYKEEESYKEEDKKTYKVIVRKLIKEEKNHPSITDDLINIKDIKWWSMSEKIPPTELPITLCIKEHPFASDCTPYSTFSAKYCGWDTPSGKHVFSNMAEWRWWYLVENEFRWTVDIGRCPDF